MLHFGNSFRSSATPAGVAFVSHMFNACKLFSPASSFSPASVTPASVFFVRLFALPAAAGKGGKYHPLFQSTFGDLGIIASASRNCMGGAQRR